MRRTVGPETLAAVVALAILGGAARGDDAAVNTGLEKFLAIGWSTAPSAFAPTIELYQELRRVAPADRRLPYAAALVLMQQRKYDLAIKRVDELLADDEHDLTAWRAKVWLAAITKNYPAAMAAAEKSLLALPADDGKNAETEEGARDYVAFLGRIFGFIGGPAGDQVKGDERKSLERKIVERLSPSRQEVFTDARDGVLDRFLKLTDTATDSREKAKEDTEKEKAKVLDDIQKEREQASERRRELAARRDKLQKELNDQLADLAKQDAPLARDLAGIQGRAAPLQNNLLTVESDIALLETRLAREQDPVRRRFIRDDIDRAIFAANRIRGDLGTLDRQAASVASQRNQLQAQRVQVQSSVGGQLDRAGKELNELDKKEKRLDGLENRASKPATGSTSRVAALGAQAGALTTYEPFPLEREKQRLLDSLR